MFLFSFLFNSSYRESKNYFKYITKDKSFNKQNAVNTLNDLIRFLDLKKSTQKYIDNINENKIIKNVLTDHFKAENTDINLIKELTNALVFDASENQVLLNKNYHEVKHLKKESNKLLENLNVLKTTYNDFSKKIDS